MPRKIDRYEIVKELGRGGQAAVYAARDTELGRPVALKVLLPGSRSAEAAERLAREAKAAAKLEHPGIVSVYDVGEFRGRQYLAMELVEGRTLSEAVPPDGMDPPEAARILAAVADAVHCAHEQGIVHRDVKPSNILLGPDGTPKLTDFGFALDEEAQARLTHTGELTGTPSYMSPEQAQGADLDARSDVYSLGAVFYEMLTGRPPFTAETALALLDKIVNEPPERPSRLNSDVPVEAETICLKCLAKEPRRRYASAAELALDANRFLAGDPIRARPASLAYRVRGMVTRRAGLIVALHVAVTGSVVFARWQRARIADAEAETTRLSAEADAALKSSERAEPRILPLRSQLDAARTRVEKLRKEIEELRSELARPRPGSE